MDAPSRPMTADAIVDDLLDVWSSFDELLASLDDDEWSTPTDCPGWTVADVVAHVIGTESMLEGRPNPDVEVGDAPHLRNDIARANETWVVARRDVAPADLLAELRELEAVRTAALRELGQAGMDADSWTPAGQATYGRFMQIRVFDTWIHEQDVREAVGRPGGLDGTAAMRTLAEVTNGIGYAVGKLAGAPDGSSVRFVVEGPQPVQIDVVVDGRAKVMPFDGEPTVTVTTDLPTFIRLVAGRLPADHERVAGRVRVDGDQELGARVVANLGYTI